MALFTDPHKVSGKGFLIWFWTFHAQPFPPALFVIFIFQVNTLAYVVTCSMKYKMLFEGLTLIFKEAKEQGVGGTASGVCTWGSGTSNWAPSQGSDWAGMFPLFGSLGGSLGGAARGREGSVMPHGMRQSVSLEKAWGGEGQAPWEGCFCS